MKDALKTRADQISQRLEELLSNSASFQVILFEAARYSLQAGKRLRPIMVLLTAETFGCPREKALDPACAIELLHSYSLIHDDLPCMDDDDFRRGRPTVHKVYGEGNAVLAGDFLLTHAFEVISVAPLLSFEEKARLTQILAKRAGGRGMIAGQIIDLACEGKTIDRKTLYFMHMHKTAALIMASFEFGAVISGASEKDRKIIKEFGKRLGLAYQVADDILDEHDLQHSDAVKKKATSVSILGMQGAKQALELLHHSAIKKLDQLSQKAPLLKEFAEALLNRKS